MESDSSMHLNPGVCLCVCFWGCVHLYGQYKGASIFFIFHTCVVMCVFVCAHRSVRPRLTVYVCQESLQESPLLERHGSNENGEHSISSSLHGKQALCYYSSSTPILIYGVMQCELLVQTCSLLFFRAVYHALYLEELTAAELIRKMASVCCLPLGTINQVYRQGPTGIHILLSDQVLTQTHTQTLFFSVRTLTSYSQQWRAPYQEGQYN